MNMATPRLDTESGRLDARVANANGMPGDDTRSHGHEPGCYTYRSQVMQDTAARFLVVSEGTAKKKGQRYCVLRVGSTLTQYAIRNMIDIG